MIATIPAAGIVEEAIDQAARPLRWQARARPGSRAAGYELPGEAAGTSHG